MLKHLHMSLLAVGQYVKIESHKLMFMTDCLKIIQFNSLHSLDMILLNVKSDQTGPVEKLDKQLLCLNCTRFSVVAL